MKLFYSDSVLGRRNYDEPGKNHTKELTSNNNINNNNNNNNNLSFWGGHLRLLSTD